MRKSIQAGILWASLLAAVTLPAYATNVPFTNFQGAWASSTTYAAGADAAGWDRAALERLVASAPCG